MMPEDDIKIYRAAATPEHPMGEGERSAALFLRHRENGNLAKCRLLGENLGRIFAGDAKNFDGDQFCVQKQVLLSFVLLDELAGIIFDQMLQKSIMSVFQQTVESIDAALADAISDSAAYTVYILCDRRGDGDDLGRAFAELCGHEDDAELIACGSQLVRRYRSSYANLVSGYDFVPVDDRR